MTVQRLQVGSRLSKAVVHGDTVYLAGIVADHPIPDVAAQTGQILDQIDKLLGECGTDKSKILTATIWLADIRYYDEMNSVWDKWVAPGNTPARACVESRLAHPKYLVEIRLVAAK
jgi:enamine deaminase RidA (YjgF/YER057c/UK114 family)